MFVINNLVNDAEFWSNEHGWTSLDEATVFSLEERQTLLPAADSVWVSLWEVDCLQFARLLSECESCGIFSDESRMQQVADELNLELPDLYSIIDRAQRRFSRFTDKLKG